MSKTLKTCGDWREFVSNIAIGIKDGDVKVDAGRTVLKALEKINENYYAEIKMAQLQLQLGKVPPALGEMPINK